MRIAGEFSRSARKETAAAGSIMFWDLKLEKRSGKSLQEEILERDGTMKLCPWKAPRQ
jgi:hypothetical protein